MKIPSKSWKLFGILENLWKISSKIVQDEMASWKFSKLEEFLGPSPESKTISFRMIMNVVRAGKGVHVTFITPVVHEDSPLPLPNNVTRKYPEVLRSPLKLHAITRSRKRYKTLEKWRVLATHKGLLRECELDFRLAVLRAHQLAGTESGRCFFVVRRNVHLGLRTK